MSLGERPRGSARPTPNEHYNSLPRTSIEGALAKDAPRRVVQAEGESSTSPRGFLALSANYVKGRLRFCIGSVTEPGILRTSRLRRSKKLLPASNSKLQQKDSPFRVCAVALPPRYL